MNINVEYAKLWEPSISGIELFSAQIVRHAFGKHFHETYTIGMNDGGLGSFLHQGKTCYAYPGSFNLINPGEIHTGQAGSGVGWMFRNIYISVSLVEQILTQLEWSGRAVPHFSKSIVWDLPLRAAFCQLFEALSQPTSQLEQESLLLEVIPQFFLKHAELRHSLPLSKPETKAVGLIRAYLEAHYTENISIDTLAQLAGLSPYYLIRSFHQQVGVPPHGYQRQWQLLQAKRLLRTSKPLAEIAVENGFYDQSHLNRNFKRAFGITPGQYRKSNSIQYG